VWVLGPDDVFGLSGLPGPQPVDAGTIVERAKALVPSRAALIPETIVSRGIDERADVAWALIGSLLVRAERAERRLAGALSLGLADRLLDELIELAMRFGRDVPGGRRIEIPLTQDLLADLTGAARETVNRALRTLTAQGVVRRCGRRYAVLDPAGPAPRGWTTPRTGTPR
jgi:CRP/FNR family cyclic AMP-dependent transcriptional regulator